MIAINIDKAKAISHDVRRAKRSEEFAPLDEVIAKQIPGADIAAVEASRQAVRDKFAEVQTQINAAATPEELKAIITAL